MSHREHEYGYTSGAFPWKSCASFFEGIELENLLLLPDENPEEDLASQALGRRSLAGGTALCSCGRRPDAREGMTCGAGPAVGVRAVLP